MKITHEWDLAKKEDREKYEEFQKNWKTNIKAQKENELLREYIRCIPNLNHCEFNNLVSEIVRLEKE